MIVLRSFKAIKLARSLDFTQGARGVYEQFANPGQSYRDVMCGLISRGRTFAYTREEDKEVLCLQGYVALWKGCAEIWVAQTISGQMATRRERNSMALKAIRLHDKIIEQWGLHRLQTTLPVNSFYHERMKRVAKLAGFQYEGTMKQYTATGTDCEIWSLTKQVRQEHGKECTDSSVLHP